MSTLLLMCLNVVRITKALLNGFSILSLLCWVEVPVKEPPVIYYNVAGPKKSDCADKVTVAVVASVNAGFTRIASILPLK
jgi:hypothetical protein